MQRHRFNKLKIMTRIILHANVNSVGVCFECGSVWEDADVRPSHALILPENVEFLYFA